MAVAFTQQEALAEVIRAMEANRSGPDGFSRREFQDQFGYSEPRAIRVLKQLKAAGRLEVVKLRRPRDLDGQPGVIPGYRLIGKGKK